MSGPRDFHAKWGKSEKKIIWKQFYVEKKKKKKEQDRNDVTRNRPADIENQFMVTKRQMREG